MLYNFGGVCSPTVPLSRSYRCAHVRPDINDNDKDQYNITHAHFIVRRTLENTKRGLSDSVKKLQRARKNEQDRGSDNYYLYSL